MQTDSILLMSSRGRPEPRAAGRRLSRRSGEASTLPAAFQRSDIDFTFRHNDVTVFTTQKETRENCCFLCLTAPWSLFAERGG